MTSKRNFNPDIYLSHPNYPWQHLRIYTVPVLSHIAQERLGLTVPKRAKKDDLIAMIEEAQNTQATQTTVIEETATNTESENKAMATSQLKSIYQDNSVYTNYQDLKNAYILRYGSGGYSKKHSSVDDAFDYGLSYFKYIPSKIEAYRIADVNYAIFQVASY